MTSQHAALLLIDTQVNMFDPAFPVRAADELLSRLTSLVSKFRTADVPVIFVRNCGGAGDPDERGVPGWELHPAFDVTVGDLVLDKTTGDTFGSTPLDDELKARRITHLVVAGLQSECCVRDTTLGALARGYEVTLISDGHGTYDGGGQSALGKSAAVNAELEHRAKLIRADDLRFQ
jgi:nicotinamidase-related amidase